MKKCSDCNAEMIEDVNLHTDYVGGVSFEEQIFVTHDEANKITTRRVRARVCPKCGKVEFYVDLNE